MFYSQIHSAVKGMIKVSIEVEKFVLKLVNIFYAQIVSKIVGPLKSQ